MRIESATGNDVAALADAWVALAAEQRTYESHLYAAENRDRIRESMAHHVFEDTCLVARARVGDEGTLDGDRPDSDRPDSDRPDSDRPDSNRSADARSEQSSGDIVGFVTFSVESDGYEMDVSRGVIENLYVESDVRGEGIGSRLLLEAERALAHRAVDVVTLEVLAANEQAREFYERAGYDDHRIVMEKPIDVETDTKGNRRP